MILLLGADGYVGQAFGRELRQRRASFVPLSRDTLDYSRFEVLFDYARRLNPELILNAPEDAAATGFGRADGEQARIEALQLNTFLPQTVSKVCRSLNTPWGHVSTGCFYSGAKLFLDGKMRVEPELNQPHLRKLFESRPDKFFGFSEDDAPNASFRNPPCSFLAGTSALAEDALRDCPNTYIWRARLPFNEMDEPANFLAKIQRVTTVHDEITSLTHLQDFARACLDLWEANARFGVYNIVNPGAISTRKVVDMIHKVLKPKRRLPLHNGQRETPGPQPRSSGCILDSSKLERAGIKMRRVEDALAKALENWDSAPLHTASSASRPTAEVIDLDSVRECLNDGSRGLAGAWVPAG